MLGRHQLCRLEGVVWPGPGVSQNQHLCPFRCPPRRVEDGVGGGVDVPRQPPLQGDFNGFTGALEDAAPGMEAGVHHQLQRDATTRPSGAEALSPPLE
jgi:hypothetical protein